MTYKERRQAVCEACAKHAECTYVEFQRTDLCGALEYTMRGWELGKQDTADAIRAAIQQRIERQMEWFDPDADGKDLIIETCKEVLKDVEELIEMKTRSQIEENILH